MFGIFVNENGCIHYAQLIVKGYKPIETRNRNMLKSLVGERVAIIRTRRGKSPMVVGYATITAAVFHTKEEMEALRGLTLIPEGSEYDCKGRGKWCYYLDNPEVCEAYPLPQDRINHGRSYCEFTKWYAVMENQEDSDWGRGNYSLEEAKEMCTGSEAYIAVISEGNDSICIREITQDEF